jgi:hypothetical protein
MLMGPLVRLLSRSSVAFSVAGVAIVGGALTAWATLSDSPALLALLAFIVLVYALAVAFANSDRPTASVWWTHPGVLLALGAAPSLLLAGLTSAQTFESAFDTPKYFNSHFMLESLVALTVAVVGTIAGSGIVAARPFEQRYQLSEYRTEVRSWARRLLAFALFGYVVFFMFAFVRGLSLNDIVSVLTGKAGVGLKNTVFRTIPGITTCTQFGPLAAGLYTACAVTSGWDKTLRRDLGALLVAALIFSVFDASRLQVVEICIPIVFGLMITASRRRTSKFRIALIGVLPVFLPFLLIIVFAVFEYGRSWSTYKYILHESYFSFVLQRVGAYYGTAANNSALQILHDQRLRSVPYWTIEWLWRFPIGGAARTLTHLAGTNVSGDYGTLLETSGNPQFNNNGGLLAPIFDWGFPFGLVVWFAVGTVLGAAHRSLVRNSIFGWIWYPVLVVGTLEVSLIFYWGDGRAFPMLVAAVLLTFLVRREGARRAVFRQMTPSINSSSMSSQTAPRKSC